MTCQIVDYDFRLNQNRKNGLWSSLEVSKALNPLCKNYIFQLEKGEGGLIHFQGSLRLIKKASKKQLLELMITTFKCDIAEVPQYIAPTVKGIHSPQKFNYDVYASKIQTRIEEPVSDKTYKIEVMKEPEYVPKQFKNKLDKLYPFQQSIYDDCKKNMSADVIDDRTINILIDVKGCQGKSVIASLCELYLQGINCPIVNEVKEIVQTVADEYITQNIRHTIPIFLDLPRAMPKKI